MLNTYQWMVAPAVALGALGACAVEGPQDETRSRSLAVGADVLAPGAALYAPPMQKGARDQIKSLRRHHQGHVAKKLEVMAKTPQAVWLEQGSPAEVEKQTRKVVKAAARAHAVPVLVAYNIPFRDCAQFSAGGAKDAAEYLAWVDGVARGIGKKPAVVILEPDGLGIIPWYPNEWSGLPEWCQPTEADPATAGQARLDMLNAAVDRLGELPNVRVYLDGTHSSWLGVAEMSTRLIKAGVARAAGFFVNASNYRPTADLIHYGQWISACIEVSKGVSFWDPLWCPGQYVETEPGSGDYQPNFSDAHVAEVDASFAEMLANTDWTGGVILSPTTGFVIDTSRNGQGPWTPPADHPEGDPQDWCNPPERGLGLRPTTSTGVDLLDAYVWIKTPGESDGECNRWEPVGAADPVRGYVNPGAGEWFPRQALELVRFASPAVRVPKRH